ncbi:acyltransferase [Roseburia sp. AM16-25]|nr:acyltransferase [Roseburia sp. AM16-25]
MPFAKNADFSSVRKADGSRDKKMTNTRAERKQYRAIDIAKFVMAILVVAIHVRPFTGQTAFVYDDIIARIADPLFFQMTAFLFFEKIFAQISGDLRQGMSWRMLGNYMKRILALYTAWFVIYAPVVLPRTWQECGNIRGMLLALLKKYWLSGYYGAMWFMTALLLAMPLVFILTKYLGSRLCLLLSAPWFLLTVARMEYCSITDGWQVAGYFDSAIYGIFGWYGNGLTYGFFFCALGMWIAYKRTLGGQKNDSRDFALPSLISFLLLIIESYVIRDKGLGQSFGAMFFLIPTSYFLLQWLLSVDIFEKMGEQSRKRLDCACAHMRRLSILIFTIHYGVMEGLQYMVGKYTTYVWNATVLYFVVLVVTIVLAELILLAQKKIKWLHILY